MGRKDLDIIRQRNKRNNVSNTARQTSRPHTTDKVHSSHNQNFNVVSSFQVDQDSEDIIQRYFQNFKDLAIAQANFSASISNSSIQNEKEDDKKDFLSMLSVTSMTGLSLREDSPKFQNNPILDSGASKHMFNNLAHFTNYEQNNNPSMNNNTPSSITGRGNVGS